MARTVWMTRHGNREDFVDPGWKQTAVRPHDPGLSPDGIEQATKLGRRLQAEGISFIFASPFLRTVHTASIVADALDLTVFLEPGLAEWMNPAWFSGVPETLDHEELVDRFPRVAPGGSPAPWPVFPETEAEALERAGMTARRLADTYAEPLLLVGHGVSVSGAVQGLVPEMRITECALCSLFRIVRREDRWHLDVQGDVSHLDHHHAGAAAQRFN